MRHFASRFLPGFLLLASFGWQAPASAQDAPPGYRARPIRIVVPVVPGGGLDIICRSVGQMLTERWGQSVIIDS
jgi:tripartite-type tricarboxylate transporter receptor subunit TctC